MEMLTSDTSFGSLLKQWRLKRNLSQLSLATKMETTTRHVSFMETGRSMPSQTMILRLSDALDVPFRERNLLFKAAGFQPHYRTSQLGTRDMGMMNHAIRLILDNHSPFPGFVLDRYWNLLNANDAGTMMLSQLAPDFDIHKQNMSLLEMLFAGPHMTNQIENWQELAKHLIQRIKRESFDDSESQTIIENLSKKVDLPREYWEIDLDSTLQPVMPMILNHGGGVRLSMLSTITTFGTPVDIMAQEVRIELVFPADAETEAFMRMQSLTSR